MRNILPIMLTFFAFFSIAAAKPASAETITLAADSWCPYNCSPTSKPAGFMVDIAKKAFEKHGIDVEYKVVPWTQAIADSRKGIYNGIIGASVKDAPDFIFPANPQGWMNVGFYVKKESAWHYDGVKSLREISLGVVQDYSYGDEIDAYIKHYNLDPTFVQPMAGDNALEINLSKLTRGKIGAVVEAKYVVNYYYSQHKKLEKPEEAGALAPSEANKLYIAFSPKDKVLAQKYADILSEEITKMRANGELKAILEVYGIADWEK
jgi:polar amino acid transport system substrate-binding protein